MAPPLLTRFGVISQVQGDPKKTEPNSNYSKYTGPVFFGSPCIMKISFDFDVALRHTLQLHA